MAENYNSNEFECEMHFKSTLESFGPLWHVCTPGVRQENFILDEKDYAFVMNATWMASDRCPEVKIITFEWMNNHVHFIVMGQRGSVLAFMDYITSKLKNYFRSIRRQVNLKEFSSYTVIPITDLNSVRNQIVYVNRNNYVTDPNYTPFSFRYGANFLYYNHTSLEKPYGKRFGQLTVKEKRAMLHTHRIDYCRNAIVTDDYVSPVSYCCVNIGEKFFRNARHYFTLLSRNVESLVEIAKQFGDMVFYTDEELFRTMVALGKKLYGETNLKLLPVDEKIELAKRMHYDFCARNNQISRILAMTIDDVNALFPLSTK